MKKFFFFVLRVILALHWREITRSIENMVFRKHLSAQSWRTIGAVLLMLSHYIGPGSSFMVAVDEARSPVFRATLAGAWNYTWSASDYHREHGALERAVRLSETDGTVHLIESGIPSVPCPVWPLTIEAANPSKRASDVVRHVSIPLGLKLKSCGPTKEKHHKRRDRFALTAVLPPPIGRRASDDRQFNEMCFKRSELLVPALSDYLPETVRRHCQPSQWSVSHPDLAVESSAVDLVSRESSCHAGRSLRVRVHFRLNCSLTQRGGVQQEELDVTLRLDPESARGRAGRKRRDAPFSFEQPVYVTSTPEERDRGLPVITVNVRDPPPMGVSYSMVAVLDARSQKMFNIDSQTGTISTATRLDREAMDVHYLRVTAAEMLDDNKQPRSATTTVQINVEDVNDFPPTFEQASYETSIKESASIGSAVLTVRAKDPDAGANAEVHYSLVNPFGANEAFRIEPRTGVISTRLALDREANDQYNLTVQAVDQGAVQDRKSATTTVHIHVGDENDNYPQFSERTYTVEVPENVSWTENPVVAHIRCVHKSFTLRVVIGPRFPR